MSGLLIEAVIFSISLVVLIKAADYFTSAVQKISLFFGLPAFIVGLSIVTLGTTLPELTISFFALLKNSSEIVVANVIGSNITNIFLVLGVAAILGRRFVINRQLNRMDLPFLISSAFLLGLALWDGRFVRKEAVFCLIGIGLYFLYNLKLAKEEKRLLFIRSVKLVKKPKPVLGDWLSLIIAPLFIYLGAKYTIESVIHLSELLKIGQELISLSAVALGTSLPELIVAISLIKKNQPEMVVGNVLGANIFNSLAIMGLAGLVMPLTMPKGALVFSLPMMIIASLLYFFMTRDRVVTKAEGWFLIAFYFFFLASLLSY